MADGKYEYGFVFDVREDKPSQVNFVGNDEASLVKHVCDEFNLEYDPCVWKFHHIIGIATGQEVPIVGRFYHNRTKQPMGVLVKGVDYNFTVVE